MRRLILVAALTAGFCSSAPASAEPRILTVPATASWQHAATGMTLPPRIAGFGRGAITDSGSDELDVYTQYDTSDGAASATVYIYRTDLPDVALWFDRAVETLVASDRFGIERAAMPLPSAFARPGDSRPTGLRTALPAAREWRSTGVAIAPLGEWLVKVRMSSSVLDAAALDKRMEALIAGMRWPAAAPAAREVRPVSACAQALTFKRAKVVKPDMTNVLLSLVGSAAAAEGKEPLPTYCRDPANAGPHGVYRPNSSTNSYVIAFNDAGIALEVAPAMTLEGLGSGGKSWSMTLLDRGTRSALLSFNRLPAPEQALSVAFGNPEPSLSISTRKKSD